MITAQNLLNGRGFDEKHMLEKAGRELDRIKSCRDFLVIYDHIINFAISVASVADWTFHLRLTPKAVWTDKQEVHFANWIRSKSPEVAAFIDISNECKHANRKHPNFVAEKVVLCGVGERDRADAPPEQIAECEANGFYLLVGASPTLVVPRIVYDSREDYLYAVAARALKWWTEVDVNQAVPMDKNLQPIA